MFPSTTGCPEPCERISSQRCRASPTGVGPYLRIAWNVFKAYLWPLTLPAAVVFVLAVLADRSAAGLTRAVMAAWDAAMATILAALAALGAVYVAFRRLESRDVPDHRPPDPAKVAAVVARENYHAHNHLAALSVIKPGLLRVVALKTVFAAIVQLATNLYRPGWLGTLGTIHFARWVRVPGTRDLIFLATADEEAGSRYGAQWVAAERRHWLDGAEYALSEFGAVYTGADYRAPLAFVSVSEKTGLPLRLTARGQPGHGSMPWRDTAPNRLVRALDRLLNAIGEHPQSIVFGPPRGSPGPGEAGFAAGGAK